MEYICYGCKRPCDKHDSKYLTGKNKWVEFGIHICHDCYYSNGKLVEAVSKVEQADNTIKLLVE